VLSVFAAVLTVYVAVDATMGAVTPLRMLTHLPVLLGAVLAVLVWRDASISGPEPGRHAAEADITLPHNASRGRRRGHLWPTDGAA
jgi:predicted anti-sigma-YlaC factor YlaD